MTAQKTEPWRRTLYVIWASQFIAMMGMSLVVPFLPFYIRDLGVTSEDEVARWSGLVFSGPFFVSFFLIPFWGYLGDRYGRKLMVVRAIFGLAVSQALIGLAQSVEMVFLFRMLQGAISGFIAAALALVAANTPQEKSGYAIGLLQTATASGNIIGPLVGGTLADAFGYRPLFFLVALICAVSGILVVKMVQEDPKTRAKREEQPPLITSYRYAYGSPRIRTALAVIFFSQVAVLMIQPIFALYIEYLAPSQSLIATLTGAIFSVAGFFMVLSSPWWGRRNDVKSYKKNLTIAISGAAVAYGLQGLATSPYHLLPLRALQGFCMGGMLPTLYSYISKHAELSRRGAVMGIASSFHTLANMVGPTMGGYVASHLGLRQNFFITGGILLLTVFFVRFFFIDLRGSFQVGETKKEPSPGLVEEAV
ncbi:MAG: MFS transporter [Ignavibacteriales bacterium]|nr:MFS transporter [Ignavibacteriales bacterium]